MRHFGKVIQIDAEEARIQIAKSSQCASCKACDMFDTKGTVEITAQNKLQAEVGDLVEVEIAPAQVIGSSLLVFIFPIIAMIIGYAIGLKLAPLLNLSGENSGILGSIAFLFLSFLIIYLYDRNFVQHKKTNAWIVARKDV
jgi:sigma-E factor negative regulatory protein RseC